MMRDKDSAIDLAYVFEDDTAVADAQPLSPQIFSGTVIDAGEAWKL